MPNMNRMNRSRWTSFLLCPDTVWNSSNPMVSLSTTPVLQIEDRLVIIKANSNYIQAHLCDEPSKILKCLE